MNILYADDTYGKASKEDPPRRIHLFGGIIVHRDTEVKIIDEIKEVKSKYTHPNMPIKWNFKDTSIKNKYLEFDKEKDYQKMLKASRDWRFEIFQRINQFDYTIIISCIEAFSNDTKVINQMKNKLNTYCFENILMRAGLDAKEKGGYWQCVLDWPPDNDTKPFDRGYYQLFHLGKASSPKPAICGPLLDLGFSHSLHFTRSNHSPMLQLADMVLGATRDHIECMIQGRDTCLGNEIVDLVYDHYRNLNGDIPRYGVVASTGNTTLVKHISKIFKRKANKSLKPISAPGADTA